MLFSIRVEGKHDFCRSRKDMAVRRKPKGNRGLIGKLLRGWGRKDYLAL